MSTYLSDENGITLKATEEAIDSIGKTVLLEGDSIIIIRDWNHLRSLNPPSYKEDKLIITTFLDKTDVICLTPCAINDNFIMSSWDLSNVKSMYFTFWNINGFNQDISEWDVSNVEDMEGLFFHSYNLNTDISSWNVSKVKNMKECLEEHILLIRMFHFGMFQMENMQEMFYETDLNQDLKQWDVEKSKKYGKDVLFC